MRYKLSLEEVEDLGVIHTTLGIQVDKKLLTLYDLMSQGMGKQKRKCFPVHDVLVEAVKK